MPRIVLATALMILSASGAISGMPEPNLRSAEAIQELIAQSLSPGDSAERIEEFLKDSGIGVSYDDFTKRYTQFIHDVAPGTVIYVQIFLDEEKRYVGSDVRYLYK